MARRKSVDQSTPSKKVHFMATLRGKHADYQRIYSIIEDLGYELVSDHVLTRKWEDILNEDDNEAREIHKKLFDWIRKASVVVYEVTTADVSIGYEIAIAFADYIPVIVLYREGKEHIPQGLKGLDDELLQLVPYTDDDLRVALSLALKNANDLIKKRQCVILPAPLLRYLKWIERTHVIKIPTYIRMLVEDDMRSNRAYQYKLHGDADES
jgi:hypothetical protein